MYSFLNFEPVHCSMSGSTCSFLTCLQVSQETGKAVWYFHLFKNSPRFVVIHTVKGFSIVNEADAYVFLKFWYILYDPADIGNLISGSCVFSKSSLYIWKFQVHILLKSSLRATAKINRKLTSTQITQKRLGLIGRKTVHFLGWLKAFLNQ